MYERWFRYSSSGDVVCPDGHGVHGVAGRELVGPDILHLAFEVESLVLDPQTPRCGQAACAASRRRRREALPGLGLRPGQPRAPRQAGITRASKPMNRLSAEVKLTTRSSSVSPVWNGKMNFVDAVDEHGRSQQPLGAGGPSCATRPAQERGRDT